MLFVHNNRYLHLTGLLTLLQWTVQPAPIVRREIFEIFQKYFKKYFVKYFIKFYITSPVSGMLWMTVHCSADIWVCRESWLQVVFDGVWYFPRGLVGTHVRRARLDDLHWWRWRYVRWWRKSDRPPQPYDVLRHWGWWWWRRQRRQWRGRHGTTTTTTTTTTNYDDDVAVVDDSDSDNNNNDDIRQRQQRLRRRTTMMMLLLFKWWCRQQRHTTTTTTMPWDNDSDEYDVYDVVVVLVVDKTTTTTTTTTMLCCFPPKTKKTTWRPTPTVLSSLEAVGGTTPATSLIPPAQLPSIGVSFTSVLPAHSIYRRPGWWWRSLARYRVVQKSKPPTFCHNRIHMCWSIFKVLLLTRENRVSQAWQQAKVIAIAKPGKGHSIVANFWLTPLLSVCFGCLQRLLLRRIKSTLEGSTVVEQAGFRQKYELRTGLHFETYH